MEACCGWVGFAATTCKDQRWMTSWDEVVSAKWRRRTGSPMRPLLDLDGRMRSASDENGSSLSAKYSTPDPNARGGGKAQ